MGRRSGRNGSQEKLSGVDPPPVKPFARGPQSSLALVPARIGWRGPRSSLALVSVTYVKVPPTKIMKISMAQRMLTCHDSPKGA
jgi:hypothetical protein